MSNWTRIDATLRIDFGNQTRYWIEKFFGEAACAVTGSEMNAVVTYCRARDYETDPRNRYHRGNEWIVTVGGSLRDRMFEETLDEWRKFAWRLGMFVRKCKRLDGRSYDDDTGNYADILFWTVDISGGSRRRDGKFKDVWYHRSSCKGGKEVVRV